MIIIRFVMFKCKCAVETSNRLLLTATNSDRTKATNLHHCRQSAFGHLYDAYAQGAPKMPSIKYTILN